MLRDFNKSEEKEKYKVGSSEAGKLRVFIHQMEGYLDKHTDTTDEYTSEQYARMEFAAVRLKFYEILEQDMSFPQKLELLGDFIENLEADSIGAALFLEDNDEYHTPIDYFIALSLEAVFGQVRYAKDRFLSQDLRDKIENNEDTVLNFVQRCLKAVQSGAENSDFWYEPASNKDDYEEDYSYNPRYIHDSGYIINNEGLIFILSQVKDKRAIEVILDMVQVTPGLLTRYTADVLQDSSRELMKSVLLKNLRSKNEVIRIESARLLMLIETGRLGITDEGLDYLNTRYDLGEFNSSKSFAQRISDRGDLGIFDEEEKLQKYFTADIATNAQEEYVQAKVVDFTIEDLFFDIQEITPEERDRREELIEEFKQKYFQFHEADFFADSHVRFSNYSLREQLSFLHYYRNATQEERDAAKGFVRMYGDDGFKVFMTAQVGNIDPRQVLEIISAMGPVHARITLRTFASFVDKVALLSELLSNRLCGDKGCSQEERYRIERKLLERGAGIWEKFDSDVDFENVVREIQGKHADVAVFAIILQELRDAGHKITIEDFESLFFGAYQGKDLEPEDIGRMKEIYLRNYQEHPELQSYVIGAFDQKMQDEGTLWYVLKIEDEVVAFNRFDKQSDGSLYFGSFNVDPNAKGAKIGEEMMLRTLDELAKDHVIEADAIVGAPITEHYLRRGFQETGRKVVGGIELVHIVRDDRKSEKIAA